MRRRTQASLAVAGVSLAVAFALAAPAQAAVPTTSGTAAGWLASQFVDGDHLTDGTFDDPGLTVDAVLALDAAGVAQDAAAKATTWLAKPESLAYLGDNDSEFYAGPLAKVALAAQAQGLDPTSFGGLDLITSLKSTEAPSGRYSDRTTGADMTNGITQALAVIALHRAGGAPQPGVDFLVGTQCADGGFPLYLAVTPCESNVDTTGFAVQALLAVGRTTDAVEGLDWLQQVQKPDGGFGGSGPTTAVNANSTGLAAAALRVGDRTAAADRAVAFLTGLQVGCAGAEPNRGAIAYDATGFSQGNAPRATAQAVPGLVGVSLAEVSNKGATPGAPALSCEAPPTTTTTDPVAAPPVAEGSGPELARTGFRTAPAIALGVLLVLLGAALIRRRPVPKGGDQ